MKGMHLKTISLFLIYGIALHLLASFFLVKQAAVLRHANEQLPPEFLTRLGAFWLISVVLAILLFGVYLRFKSVSITSTQKHHIMRLGRTVTLIGLVSILLACLFLYVSW